jgi:hypothetical protein
MYFALQSTVMVKNLCTVKLSSISVREICLQRINNYLQTVLVRGKIAGPGRSYLCISGLPTLGIFLLKRQILGFFEKLSGHF